MISTRQGKPEISHSPSWTFSFDGVFRSRREQNEPFSIVVCGSTVERDQTFICGLAPRVGEAALAVVDGEEPLHAPVVEPAEQPAGDDVAAFAAPGFDG